MADTYEKDLAQKSSLTTSDYIRVVGSNNASYKQLVSDVAKKIIENYTGSSLAGSSQSVKSALDALNSKTDIGITLSTEGNANFILTINRSGKKNGIYVVDFTLQAKQGISSTSEMNIGTVSIAPLATIGTVAVRSNDTKAVGTLLISNNKSVYLRLTEPISENHTIVVSMCGY